MNFRGGFDTRKLYDDTAYETKEEALAALLELMKGHPEAIDGVVNYKTPDSEAMHVLVLRHWIWPKQKPFQWKDLFPWNWTK